VTHEEEVAHHCKRILRFRDGRILKDETVENPVDARDVLASMPLPEDAVPTS
jgi:putative ABC transport system ATP-binding protein